MTLQEYKPAAGSPIGESTMPRSATPLYAETQRNREKVMAAWGLIVVAALGVVVLNVLPRAPRRPPERLK
jgi:hypothetical protein